MTMTQEEARQKCIEMMKEEKKKNLTLFVKNLITTAVIFTIGAVILSLLEQSGIQIRLLRNFILFVMVLAVMVFVEMGIFGILARYLRAANALRRLEKGFDASVDYVKMLETPAPRKNASAKQAKKAESEQVEKADPEQVEKAEPKQIEKVESEAEEAVTQEE